MVLNQIASNRLLSPELQIHSALDLAIEHLQVEVGLIATIHSSICHINWIVSKSKMPGEFDRDFALTDSSLSKLLRADSPQRIPLQSQLDLPSILSDQTQVIGGPLYVFGKCYGFLAFTCNSCTQGVTSEVETRFIELLTVWLGATIERQQTEAQLRQSERRFRDVVAAAGEYIWELDLGGRIRFLTSPIEKITGWTVEDLMGTKFSQLMSIEEIKHWESAYQDLLTKPRAFQKIEFAMLSKQGNIVWQQLSGLPMYGSDSSLKGYRGVGMDITITKNAEKMKDEFVSTVSHELRTPLTSIIGSLGLIESGAMGSINQQIEELIQIAGKNAQRLELLINDLLDMEKINLGKMRICMKWQPLSDIIKQSVEDLESYAKQFDVDLVYEPSEDEYFVEIDNQRLLQILTNFLSNSIKFSPPHSKVSIGFQLQNDKLRVKVDDSGRGIPETFKQHLFEKFSQLDSSSTRSSSGTGLGLAISKSLSDYMGIDLDYISKEGEGSCFWVDIPGFQLINPKSPKLWLSNEYKESLIAVVTNDSKLASDVCKLLVGEGLCVERIVENDINATDYNCFIVDSGYEIEYDKYKEKRIVLRQNNKVDNGLIEQVMRKLTVSK